MTKFKKKFKNEQQILNFLEIKNWRELGKAELFKIISCYNQMPDEIKLECIRQIPCLAALAKEFIQALSNVCAESFKLKNKVQEDVSMKFNVAIGQYAAVFADKSESEEMRKFAAEQMNKKLTEFLEYSKYVIDKNTTIIQSAIKIGEGAASVVLGGIGLYMLGTHADGIDLLDNQFIQDAQFTDVTDQNI